MRLSVPQFPAAVIKAVQWFTAPTYLLQGAGRIRWEEIHRQDVQELLLERYGAAYASNLFCLFCASALPHMRIAHIVVRMLMHRPAYSRVQNRTSSLPNLNSYCFIDFRERSVHIISICALPTALRVSRVGDRTADPARRWAVKRVQRPSVGSCAELAV